MLRIAKTIDIEAPLEHVFGYVTDPTHLPEYHPGIVEVKDVEQLPNGGYRWTTVDRVLGFHMSSAWQDVDFVPNEGGANEMHNALMDVTARARFERLPDARTRASNVAEVRMRGGPVGRLVELLIGKWVDRGAEQSIRAAKRRIEASVGP